ncbi:hypothetical protein [Piscinibacter sakaiensis]|uniref:hypothetical protein n=1 Tax=Piscinibacter sakaiensis TaxID=1547922 RepID=UPI003AAD215B
MYRCFAIAATVLCLHAPSLAQVQRLFPPDALRGEIVVQAPPAVLLNGNEARLAPGARIRGEDNLLKMSTTLIGSRLTVNYTIDTYGLVRDVWILRPEEVRKRPWPRTMAEARAWQFNPTEQSWSKP